MLGLIIFGTRSVTSEQARGAFFCPGCQARRPYVHKEQRRYFTLYFIPLIPLKLIAEYIECLGCMTAYKLEVLRVTLARDADAERHQADVYHAMSRVLALVSLADDRVAEAELAVIAGVLSELGQREVPRAEIEAELALARASKVGVVRYCREVKEFLDDGDCQLIVQAAIRVASSGGPLDDTRRALVVSIADALEVSPAWRAALAPDASREPTTPRGGAASGAG